MDEEIQKILNSPLGNSIMQALQTEPFLTKEQREEILISTVGSYHNLVGFTQSMFKAPVVLAHDTVGGRLVPLYGQQQQNQIPKKPDFKKLSERIFKNVWGITPKESDILQVEDEINTYFSELTNPVINNED